MAPRRLATETKKLRGTYEASRETHIAERVRLLVAIDPPAGLDADVKREWQTHMRLLVLNGAASPADLRAFLALCQAAALCERSYKLARDAGPGMKTEAGGLKAHPAWSGWTAASSLYFRWCSAFGLVPHAAQGMAALPAPKTPGRLSVVA
jgi:P27 family predicted phage terminase small subunit